MTLDLSTAMDFVSALALLAVLASSYGWLKRTLPQRWLAELVLGALFGLVAILQMSLPVEPRPGIVVDLRSIPVALAGAFLGWRGALSCAGIAMAMRWHLGGVGAPVGMTVVAVTALLGLGWARATRARPRRGRVALLGLGAMTACNAVTVVLLPTEIAWWFVANITPILTVAYIVLVPLFAAMMQREDAAIWVERQLRASASTDPATGLLTMDALTRAAARMASRAEPPRGAALVLLRIRHARWIEQVHGAEALDTIRAAMRARLEGMVACGDVLARTRTGCIAVLMADRDEAAAARLAREVARILSTRSIRFDDDGEMRVSLDMGRAWSTAMRPLSEMMTEASRSLEENAYAGGFDVDASAARRGAGGGPRDALLDRISEIRRGGG